MDYDPARKREEWSMRTVKRILAGVALLQLVAASAGAAETTPSPYAGFEAREIKSLSPQEVKGLLAGEGLMASLPAELNGFPGPRHVIELGDQLGLSETQRVRAREIEGRMQQSATSLGAEVVALEAQLDQRFREGRVDLAEVTRLSAEIGAKRGALRAVHLGAHLAMADALTGDQRERYMTLRGYHHGAMPQHGSGPRHH
jgi:hypothetical protein